MSRRPMRGRRPTVWRRRLVAGAALVLAGIVAWRLVAAAIDPDRRGAHLEHLTIDSRAVGRRLPVSVVVPGSEVSERRPILVFLHGFGGNQSSELGGPFYSALADVGRRAPIVAFPAGDNSFWHDRGDGDWGRYVVAEVIPRVARRYGGDPRRVAIGGISMGGFGAFDLAEHYPGRFCAVGGHSPALWRTGAETAAGAFDDAEDFARNDVIGAARTDPAPLTGEPLWLDAGADDPFQPGDRAFAAALRADGADATIKLSRPGGHTTDYWNEHWGEYMRFYATALARCRR